MMAAVKSLHTHLVDELADLLDAERQLVNALPKMARGATAGSLRAAFQKHLNETRTHVTRLNQALGDLGESPRSKTCEAMK
jgi:ferritin-like metal-binding protein YciE